MRICFVTIGSRGDIQPFILLGKYLRQQENWSPVIVTHRDYERWIVDSGLEFVPVTKQPVEFEKIIFSPNSVNVILSGNFSQVMKMMRETPEQEASSFEAIEEACQGADLLVANQVTMMGVGLIGEKLKIPVGFWFPFPCYRTKDFAHPISAIPDWRPWNPLSYDFLDQITWKFIKSSVLKYREQFGLSPIESAQVYRKWLDGHLSFYAYSPTVVPPPKDLPANITVGGFIRDIDPTGLNAIDASLMEFISKDKCDTSPVIYLGFGSMPVATSDKFNNFLNDLYVELDRHPDKYRFVIFAGKCTPYSTQVAHLTDERPNVRFVSSIPHEKLFPLCDFILHHGGAGTTAAALGSGTPSAVIPIFYDQIFWAKQTRRALKSDNEKKILKFQDLNPRKLMKLVKHGLSLKSEARTIADLMALENGLESAADWIKKLKHANSQNFVA